MSHVFIFLAALGSLLILTQWFAFVSVRRYLFQQNSPLSRRTAYTVLLGLAVWNCVLLRLSMGTAWIEAGSSWAKLIAIFFFSYLGVILMVCVFFIGLALLSGLLHVGDLFSARIRASGTRRGRGGPRKTTDPPEPACAPASQGNVLSSEHTVSHEGIAQPMCAETGGQLQFGMRRWAPPDRRLFLKWSAAAGLTAVAGFAGCAVAQAYASPVIEEYDLTCPGLFGLNNPISILQVSDFHFGIFFDLSDLETLVERLNRIEADALMITGDIFHSPLSPEEEAVPVLRRLRERRFGNFAVMGNHDFYAGEARSVRNIRKSGLRLLRDEWVTIRAGEAAIHIGGIDDPMGNWLLGKDFPLFKTFMARAPSGDGMRILLSHRPAVLPLAARGGFDLVLAGHIHGGQIIVPVPGRPRGVSLARIVSPYTRGWYEEGGCRLYLNRGVGLTFLPWRINCPPEITLIRLHAPSAGRSR